MGRREQALASREALVAAARDTFAECGYESATVAEILRRAGMARGALYHYFPSGKAGIFSAVYDTVDDLLHAELDEITDAGSHLDALRAGLAVYLRFCTQDAYSRITIVDAPWVLPAQRSPRNPTHPGRAYGRLRTELAAATAAGEIACDDLDSVAAALYGAAQELGARVFVAADRASALRHAINAMNVVIGGLSVRNARAGHDRTEEDR